MSFNRIAVDWDGTVVTNEWPKQSEIWTPGSVEALRAISQFSVPFIYTSRIAKGPEGPYPEKSVGEVQVEINYIREMLDSVGLQHIEVWNKPWKPGAIAYVDDKAVHYSGRKHAWEHLVDKLEVMVDAA